MERRNPAAAAAPSWLWRKIEGREDDVFSFKGTDGRNVPVFPDFIRRCILFGDKGSGENQAGSSGDYRIVRGDGWESDCVCGYGGPW
ncbi:MAG: hypothetical protein ACLTBV_21975 [Enterocloster bolteae]